MIGVQHVEVGIGLDIGKPVFTPVHSTKEQRERSVVFAERGMDGSGSASLKTWKERAGVSLAAHPRIDERDSRTIPSFVPATSAPACSQSRKASS